MSTRSFSTVARLLAVLVVLLAVFATPASAASQPRLAEEVYPPEGKLVWYIWLNEFVDVVDPQYSIDCWDAPIYRYEGTEYFGYRVCFLMIELEPGRWYLSEWRGQLGVPLKVERNFPVGALPLTPFARGPVPI